MQENYINCSKQYVRQYILPAFLQSTGTIAPFGTYFGTWGDFMYWFLFWLAICNLAYFALHTSTTGSFPKPLSAKEERECLQAVRAGDQKAKEKLIVHNLRLVAHIVKRHYSGNKDQDDLISTGTIGLIKAASTFDCEKGIRFATYASRCIENAILPKQPLRHLSVETTSLLAKNGALAKNHRPSELLGGGFALLALR